MTGSIRRSIATRALAGLLAAATVSCGGAPAQIEGADRVRAVVLPYLTMAPLHIARAEGLFLEQDLDVEFVRLGRIQELMTALARGEVDVAAGMLTIGVLSSIAAGARVRVVGALGHLDRQRCAFNGFVARSDLFESGALEEAERIRELRWDADVLLPHGFWIDEFLRPHGLTTGDLHIVNLPEPTAVEAIRSGAIDVTIVSEPFLGRALSLPQARLWTATADVAPDYPISVVMYGPGMLEPERLDTAERFATALLAAITRWNEGKTPSNERILAEATGLDPVELRQACWPPSRSDGRVEAADFSAYQHWALERGLVGRVLTADELIDDRFMRAAMRRLDL